MLDKVASKYEFRVREIGSFRYAIHVGNRASTETLARVAHELEPGSAMGRGAIALAVYGLCLYDEGYETLMRNSVETVGGPRSRRKPTSST